MYRKAKFDLGIKVLTGMHIGVGNDKVQIGGVDSAVIKIERYRKDGNTVPLPYIPGSTIKGKMRSLLETEGGYENGVLNKEINLAFGATPEFRSAIKDESILHPTSFIFRDLYLSKDWEEKYLAGKIENEFKTEIKVNRRKGTAQDGQLRTIERVPPGVEFIGEVIIRYNASEEADLDRLSDMLTDAAELLNDDFLGGSGSRGYGAVEVFNPSQPDDEEDD